LESKLRKKERNDSQLSIEVEKLRARVKDLEERLAYEKAVCDGLRQSEWKLTHRTRELQASLKSLRQESTELHTELERTNARLREVREENERLRKRLRLPQDVEVPA